MDFGCPDFELGILDWGLIVLPHALCPMPHAPCAMRYAQCPMRYAHLAWPQYSELGLCVKIRYLTVPHYHGEHWAKFEVRL
jgi:hypothetical protein